MSKIKLNCSICNKEFERKMGEYNRSIKFGRPQYCSRTCAGKANVVSLGKYCGDIKNLKGKGKIWRKDEFTPFRYYLRSIKRRAYKKGKTDITVEFLKQLWEEQRGICPFTGWKLLLPRNNKDTGNGNSIYRASLDRINNSKGYIEGNVRFVAIIANYCRNNFTDNEVKLFCKAVVNNK